jgi:hypothetical protein
MMPMDPARAYDEYVDFVTSSPSLEEIITFRPSALTEKRVRYLLRANRSGQLTAEEQAELQEFQRAREFMHDLKVRARRRLRQGR